MTKEFEERLQQQSERIMDALEYERFFMSKWNKGTRHKTRIRDAMSCDILGKRMQTCSDARGNACGSIFCDRCLDKRQRNLYATYRNRFEKVLGRDTVKARRRLRWVTVLGSVVAVNVRDRVAEQWTLDEVASTAESLRSDVSRLSRGSKGFWMRGAIHVELVDYSLFEYAVLAGKATAKERTLTQFIDASDTKWERHIFEMNDNKLCFLVHFHALVDLCEYDEKALKQRFLKRWSLTSRQVHFTSIWKHVTTRKGGKIEHRVEDALKAFARYCYSRSNARLDFARNWGAGEIVFETGEQIDAQGHIETYAKEMLDRDLDGSHALSKGELRLLVLAHYAVDGPFRKGLNVSVR